MARVLFLSLVFEPDTTSTSTIAALRVVQLQQHGHDVAVLTSVPHYNVPPHVAADPRYRASLWHPVIRSRDTGTTVVRCFVPPKRTNFVLRAVDLVILHAGLVYGALRYFRDRDVVVVVSPPLTLALVGLLLKRLAGTNLVYNLQELWPDAPRDLGVIRSKSVLSVLSALERFIYRASDVVVPIGPRFGDIIKERGAPADRVRVIPNFVDTTWIAPTAKDNELAREWGVADKPVVLYSGNLGLTQDFDTMFELARLLDDLGIVVIIVGGGSSRVDLKDRIGREQPHNVMLKDYVPRERVSELYGLADVVAVLMKRGHDRTTTPSKIFSAMAARRPLLVSAADDTDLATTVRETRAGVVVPVEDTHAAAKATRRILEGNAPEWDADRAWDAVRAYSPEAVGRAYHELITKLIAAP